MRKFIGFLVALSFLTGGSSSWGQSSSFEETINSLASMPLTRPQEVKVLMDNHESYLAKKAVIQDAQAGDTIFTSYYIHEDDEITSEHNKDLIEAAQRGVKIFIMDDFLTNYHHIDMYNMLAQQGRGFIKISFFNAPTAAIHQDVLYLTSNCLNTPKACQEEKSKIVKEAMKNNGTIFSKLFLAGLSAKSPDAMKTAIMAGGTIPAMGQGGQKPSADDLAQLKDFIKILFGAEVMGRITDKIKLAVAFQLYGEKVGPIYEAIDKALPVNLDRDLPSLRDWEKITDFTHHKILARFTKNGELTFISGGRNEGKEYHENVALKDPTTRYRFHDTDIKVVITKASAVQAFREACKQFFSSPQMVSSLETVNKDLPSDLVNQLPELKQAIEMNKALKTDRKTSFLQYAQAVEKTFVQLTQGKAEQRQAQAYLEMLEKARKYEARKEQLRNQSDPLKKTLFPAIVESLNGEDANAQVAYIENLPFNKGGQTWFQSLQNTVTDALGLTSDDHRQRTYDVEPGKDDFDQKNIHSTWVEMFKKTAEEAAATKTRTKIIIPQGYILFPSNMLEVLKKMITGEINSEYIDLVFATNSKETTDLLFINMMADHQFKALFEFYEQYKGRPGSLGSLRIYELLKDPVDGIVSLHSKTMFTPSMIWIGSANLDVRSYVMDANNGVLITNAPHLAQKLSNQMEQIIANPEIMREVTDDFKLPHNVFLKRTLGVVESILARRAKIGNRLRPHLRQIMIQLFEKMTREVYLPTGVILDPHEAETWLGRRSQVNVDQALAAAGAASGTAGNCVQALTVLNTRSEMIEKIQALKQVGSEKLKFNFDRTFQGL